MIFIFLSIAVLAIAPLVAKWFEHSPNFESVLAGFLLVVLGGIIFFELIPMSFTHGGWPVIALAVLGFMGPSLIEKLFRKAADSTHQVTLMIGFSGLLLHTMVDGASLNEFKLVNNNGPWLPIAIVIHRIPVALSVLWIIRPVFGLKAVWLALAALATFTLFGYVLGIQLENAMTSESFAWLQAFVSGTLMHVLLHRPHRHDHDHDHKHQLTDQFKRWGKFHGLGVLLGLISLSVLAYVHH